MSCCHCLLCLVRLFAALHAAPACLSACLPTCLQQLVWPPLHHSSLTYHKKVEVHLVYMVEGLQKPHPGDGR